MTRAETPRKPAFLQPLWRFVSWLGLHELGVLVSVLCIVAGVWFFVMLAGLVVDGSTVGFDERILLAMRTADDAREPVGPPWLQEVGRDLTALGGVAVLFLLTTAVALYLLLQRKVYAVLVVLASVGGGVLLSILLKTAYDRPRPELVPHGSFVALASFPSGHSMMAAIVYLTLGALLARVEPQRRVKAFLLLTAFILTFLVGASRIYMGVHWPTDVLAGWTAGAVWALVCWLIARRLQREGQMETDAASEA